MPVLKYHCHNCGNEFAKIFFDPEQAPKKCPVCDAPNPKELGLAFNQDSTSLARAMCGSCDLCGADTDSCGTCGV